MTATANLKNLQAICDNATTADVVLETLSEGKLSVSVHWPETQCDDGDHCHGQGTIVGEAYKVLAALESDGWQHCAFGGRKDFGHSGGTTHFAVAREPVLDYEIGGLHVRMTATQADQWNSGDISSEECQQIAAFIPVETNDYREMTLAEAMADDELMEDMEGMRAVRT